MAAPPLRRELRLGPELVGVVWAFNEVHAATEMRLLRRRLGRLVADLAAPSPPAGQAGAEPATVGQPAPRRRAPAP